MSNTVPTTLSLAIAGTVDESKVQAIKSENTGNTYWATIKAKKAGGVYVPTEGLRIPALANELPKSVVLDGVTLELEAGRTNSGPQAKKGATQNPKASFSGKATLPSIGEEKAIDLRVSVVPERVIDDETTVPEHWLLYVSVHGIGGGKAPTPKVEGFGDLAGFAAL